MHEEALHGYVARGATSFPQAIALASTWDPELVTQSLLRRGARDARARRLPGAGAGGRRRPRSALGPDRGNLWRGPLSRHPDRAGGDPRLPGPDAAARRPTRCCVTLKHITGHGQPENGTNVGPARPRRAHAARPISSRRSKRAVKTYPVRSVMASYNEIDGIPSHANGWLLNGVLRGEWGYQGAVVSDYYAIRELMTRHKLFANVTDAAERAIKSGVDVETPDPEGYRHLPELVRDRARLARSWSTRRCGGCFALKFESGLFENPYPDAATAEAKTATPDAIALAREAAGKADRPAQERQASAPARRREDPPHGGDRHARTRHADRRLQRRARAMSSACSKACRRTRKGKLRGRLCRRRAHHREPLLVVRRGQARPRPRSTASLIAEAVKTARKADVIVMVLGDNEQTSREGLGGQPSRRPLLARPGRAAGGSRARDPRARQADRRRPAQRPAAVGQLSRAKSAGAARRLVPRPGDRPRRRRRVVRPGQSGRQAAGDDRALGRPAAGLSTTTSRPRGAAICSTRPRRFIRSATGSATPASTSPRRACATPAVRLRTAGERRRRRRQHRTARRATRSCSSTSATTKPRSPAR